MDDDVIIRRHHNDTNSDVTVDTVNSTLAALLTHVNLSGITNAGVLALYTELVVLTT